MSDAIKKIRKPKGWSQDEMFWGADLPEPIDFSQGPWWFKNFEEMFDCLARWGVGKWSCRWVSDGSRSEGWLEVQPEEGFYGY